MKLSKPEIFGKIKIIHFIVILFTLLLLFFLVRWNVVEGSKFTQIANSRVQSSEIDSVRGSIYSDDGSTLAYSEPRVNVYIWLPDLEFFEQQKLQTRDEFISKIASIIKVKQDDLTKTINKYIQDGVQRIPIAKEITIGQWQEIQNLKSDKYPDFNIKGVDAEFTSKRIYPEGNLAAHVLGLTNTYKDQVIGVGGLEGNYNDMLNPVKGYVIQENDARGQAVTNELLPTIEPKNGSNIYTSIDEQIQKIIQKDLKNGVEKYQAKSGSIVVMDPKTGRIIALANYPDYDPNTRSEKDPNAYGDLGITSPYEIGSVGKIFTSSAAIELGVVTPDTIILPNGHQGCEKISNDLQPICTWDKKPQPPMPLWKCFVLSDNICFYHVALKLDRKDFYDYLAKFGIGVPSGIDLSGESYGPLKDYENWTIGDVAAFSYGHGYLLNTVQATEAAASIAMGGIRMKPMIVTKVEESDGTVKDYNPVVVGRTVSKKTANEVTDMMRKYYSDALDEWYYWDLNKYDIAVKSGTALIANSTGYSNDINATYVGFDASDQHTFIMLLRLERPQIPAGDLLSYYNARPMWLDTFNDIKDYLGVPTK